jgi:single-strand DNA-binding protein
MNNICLVGKIVVLPEVKETINGSKVATLEVEVERNFPNSDGEYESDIFVVTLWKGLAENASALCEVDSIVGIKGRLLSKQSDKGFRYCEIIAEKLSFISK